MDKRFSIHDEDMKKQIAKFQEIISTIDKKVISEAFKLGLDVGFFKGLTSEDDLYLQFSDGQRYVYTIIRMPIKHKKQSNNMLENIIGGKRF